MVQKSTVCRCTRYVRLHIITLSSNDKRAVIPYFPIKTPGFLLFETEYRRQKTHLVRNDQGELLIVGRLGPSTHHPTPTSANTIWLFLSILAHVSALPAIAAPLGHQILVTTGDINTTTWSCSAHTYNSSDVSRAIALGYALLHDASYVGTWFSGCLESLLSTIVHAIFFSSTACIQATIPTSSRTSRPSTLSQSLPISSIPSCQVTYTPLVLQGPTA